MNKQTPNINLTRWKGWREIEGNFHFNLSVKSICYPKQITEEYIILLLNTHTNNVTCLCYLKTFCIMLHYQKKKSVQFTVTGKLGGIKKGRVFSLSHWPNEFHPNLCIPGPKN